MPRIPPRKCAEPDCRRLTHYRYCREHRTASGPGTTRSARHRLCLTLSEIAGLCKQLTTKGVQARAVLTETGVALHFDNGVEPARYQDIGFNQLLAIGSTDETTELMQSILRSFAREAQATEYEKKSSAAA